MSDKLNLSTLGAMTEEQARKYFENLRWPSGPVCPHCGVVNEATAIAKRTAKSEARDGLWQCRPCGKQFSVTVGTVMEGSHLPLRTWLLATNFLCSAKKSGSARQLQRHLGLGSYRTAWFLCHRIRLMMANGGPQKPFSGDVEADEVYLGGKPRTRPTSARRPSRASSARSRSRSSCRATERPAPGRWTGSRRRT